jgi:hypothetical protein
LCVRWYFTYRLSYRGHCHLGAGHSMAWSRPRIAPNLTGGIIVRC